jgi:hypothetical protein
LSPLYEALYPPKEAWRKSATAPGCPPFGATTVLNRPPDQHEEVSVRPGLHTPRAGSHKVVWFDPAVLKLRATRDDGVEHEAVFQGTPEDAVEGLRRYQEFCQRRAARIELGGTPRFRTATAEHAARGTGAQFTVETITLPWNAGRPSGRKFGRLVHDMLQHAGLADDLEALAAVWGHRHGASEFERAAAIETVGAALAHPVLAVPESARRYRELPILVRLDDGTMVDGRIDFAWTDGASWTVIDYKTDRRSGRDIAQVRVYALALSRATGLPVRAIVFEV